MSWFWWAAAALLVVFACFVYWAHIISNQPIEDDEDLPPGSSYM